MSKRKDECLFCKSRKCYTRVVSTTDNGKIYDELACSKHICDVEKDSDKKAPKVMKLFMSGTGRMKRGEDITNHLKEFEKYNDKPNKEVTK
ncbi:MAG TPA: hypothetical protein VIK78_19555 [Ruminiclostridium sp.]